MYIYSSQLFDKMDFVLVTDFIKEIFLFIKNDIKNDIPIMNLMMKSTKII